MRSWLVEANPTLIRDPTVYVPLVARIALFVEVLESMYNTTKYVKVEPVLPKLGQLRRIFVVVPSK